MRTLIKTTVFGLTLALTACGGAKEGTDKKEDKKVAKAEGGDANAEGGDANAEGGEEAAPLDPKVEQAVTVANKISAEPDKADAILEEAGLDRSAFDALLYEIAQDPDLSASYVMARKA